jgi:YlmC/YmxH family sporulation protein
VGVELSFCELRCKQVINVIDGKVLGRIVDVVFSRGSAKILGFVVPGDGAFHFLKKRGDIFIPFERICKIGIDVVIVELKPAYSHCAEKTFERKCISFQNFYILLKEEVFL